jgi:hypothetical protein
MALICVNYAIIHTENENCSTLAHWDTRCWLCLGQAIWSVMQTIRRESRPEHRCSSGEMEPSWPGLSACIQPWTRTRCWAVVRCLPHCTWHCRHPQIWLEQLWSWIWNLKGKGKQISCYGGPQAEKDWIATRRNSTQAAGNFGIGKASPSMGVAKWSWMWKSIWKAVDNERK